MSLLVFGKTGQLAQALALQAPDAIYLDRQAADHSDPAACVTALEAHAPSLVINAVAYTAVDRAEEEEALATTINGETPGALARACAAKNIPFLHVSTDYVFDGSGTRPWAPSDPTAPLGAYGRSKLAGEQAITAADGPHAILRTAWVFSEFGNNFVKTMLRLGAERDKLTIVADQIGGPTSAHAIASALLIMAKRFEAKDARSGIYHFAGVPPVSWADFARAIFAQAKITCAVEDIPSSAYPTPAKRPFNSRLDCTDIKTYFDINEPDWISDLTHVLKQLETAS